MDRTIVTHEVSGIGCGLQRKYWRNSEPVNLKALNELHTIGSLKVKPRRLSKRRGFLPFLSVVIEAW